MVCDQKNQCVDGSDEDPKMCKVGIFVTTKKLFCIIFMKNGVQIGMYDFYFVCHYLFSLYTIFLNVGDICCLNGNSSMSYYCVILNSQRKYIAIYFWRKY